MESNGLGGQHHKSSKKSFFFGRKKRKPICTCHLYQETMAARLAQHNAAAAAARVATPTELGYGQPPEMSYFDATATSQASMAGPYAPSNARPQQYGGNALAPLDRVDPSNCSQFWYSTSSSSTTQHHHHQQYHHQHRHHHHHHNLLPSGERYQFENASGGVGGVGGETQQLEDHMAAMSLYEPPPPMGKAKAGEVVAYGRMPPRNAYNHHHQLGGGNHQMLTYSPDLSMARKRYDEPNGTKEDRDYLVEVGGQMQQQQQQQQQQQPSPLHQRRCDCRQCQDSYYLQAPEDYMAKTAPAQRPKVSFGPSQMYPAEVELMQQQQQQEREKKEKKQGMNLELLPLDAQMSFQMMPEAGFMCSIV